MPTTTPYQALPVPVDADDPNIPADMMSLAVAIEKRLVQQYASVAARSAANTTPSEGQFSYIATDDTFWYYNGTTWTRLYLYTTPRPTITVSTSAPSGGVNGDIHFRV